MRRATVIAVVLALSAALAAPAPAGAAGPTGNTTLTVTAAKARTLGKRGIALAGVRGADTVGRQTRLQIGGGEIEAGEAALTTQGALRFLAGKGRSRRAVRLSSLVVQLGQTSTLSGKLGGDKRRVLFDLRAPAGGLLIDPAEGTAQLHRARLAWRRGTLRTLRRKLGAQVPGGILATMRVGAATVFDRTPQPGPLSDEPPRLARPASAVDVTSASLTWHVRDSWIRYANTETAPETLEGASAGAPIAESSHPCPDRPASTDPTLVYSYSFPFAEGWYDGASGEAALYGLGGVRFKYLGHGIDLTTRNPEIEINGSASRAIFRLRGEGALAYPDKRAAILSLALTSAPAEGPAGTFTLGAPIRGSLTNDGQAVFAGFYPPPNNGFGCFSVSFTTG
ncbi:MAG TPA: HtaA domain-containing protein [Solirubrobacterales bacterium]|nr:HtaA domain-containing protein [Solirubrobacterales bacterium]